jgi:SAM-dependent methyltransferase
LISADAEQFEWSERFDIVTSFETIEHLYDPEKFLERIHNLLIPDGVFLLCVPLGETRHMDRYHLHAFSQEEMFALLKKTGFSVDWHHCDECFLTRSELLRWGKLYPESSPSINELLFSRRGWRIIYDFVFRGGFDIPQVLIYARRIN